MAKPAKPDFRASLAAHQPLYIGLGLGSPLGVEIAGESAGMPS